MSSANGVQQVWGGCSCWLSMPEVEEGADRWPHLWAALEREGGVTDFAGQGRGKRAERTGPGEREGGGGGEEGKAGAWTGSRLVLKTAQGQGGDFDLFSYLLN